MYLKKYNDHFLWTFLVSNYMYNVKYTSIKYIPCSMVVRIHLHHYRKVLSELKYMLSPLLEKNILPDELVYEIYKFL